MVINVILLEHHRKRHPDRHVGRDRKQAVLLDAAEREVVGDLVHGQERVLGAGTAHEPRDKEELEAPERGVAHQERGGDVENLDGKDEVLCERVVTHQLLDLRRGEGEPSAGCRELRNKQRLTSG